tara:strand:- start:810 stop:2129 length:1320 start_codon:yes stop_codon:yes gene_type:complete
MLNKVSNYLKDVDAIRITFERIVPFLDEKFLDSQKRIDKYVDQNKLQDYIKSGEGFPEVHHSTNFLILAKERSQSGIAYNKIPPILLVNSLSVFENYLSELMVDIFKKYPQKFDEKNVSIKDLRNYQKKGFSLEESMSKIINDKIEEELRAGYQGKIKLLKKMDINDYMTNSEEAEFGYYYELRNIIAHHNCIATNKFLDYINNSKDLQHKEERSKKAKKSLENKKTYRIGYELRQSFNFLLKIGLKLGEVTARKYSDEENEEINNFYNSYALDFLDIDTIDANFDAYHLFKRGLANFDFKDKNYKQYFRVNVCLALKANMKKFKSILNIKKSKDKKIIKEIESLYLEEKKKINISYKNNTFEERMFEFAILILDEDYKEASKLLVNLDKHDEDLEKNLRRFPMLKEYVKTRSFKVAFKKMYNKDFIPLIDIEDSYEEY